MDFKTRYLDIDGKRARCMVWDTAGQERFHVITRSYYKGASGILLVYDVSEPESFEHCKYWVKNIESTCDPGIPKLLLCNKVR